MWQISAFALLYTKKREHLLIKYMFYCWGRREERRSTGLVIGLLINRRKSL